MFTIKAIGFPELFDAQFDEDDFQDDLAISWPDYVVNLYVIPNEIPLGVYVMLIDEHEICFYEVIKSPLKDKTITLRLDREKTFTFPRNRS